MLREITYTEEVRVCDICTEEADLNCEICGKDLCERHIIWRKVTSFCNLRLCPECNETVDFTEYENKYMEIKMKYAKIDQLHDEAEQILEKIREQKTTK